MNVGDSQITNQTGFLADPLSQFESMGDNVFAGNVSDIEGSVAVVPGK